MAPLDPDALELLRARSGLSIDVDGRLCHRGEPITHARTLEVLWRSLERGPDGRYLVHVGRESGYVQVDDAPYVIVGVEIGEAGLVVALNDGTREPLDPRGVRVDAQGILRCDVKGGHRARFGRTPQVELGLRVEEDPGSPSGFALCLPSGRFSIRQE